jgi:hypothetical protein
MMIVANVHSKQILFLGRLGGVGLSAVGGFAQIRSQFVEVVYPTGTMSAGFRHAQPPVQPVAFGLGWL